MSSSLEDLVVSDELTGAPAMWLAQSMAKALPRKSASGAAVDLSTITGSEQKRWRDIWSAGQGLAGVRSVSDTASIVEQLLDEYNNVLASIAAP
ncbi:MAG: hypothetical protein EOO27_27585 [Comamonadaceae bacterium]|nr:MAG: hypothetical protein EOO27_27585 [Comamonadaceae bacterium]